MQYRNLENPLNLAFSAVSKEFLEIDKLQNFVSENRIFLFYMIYIYFEKNINNILHSRYYIL